MTTSTPSNQPPAVSPRETRLGVSWLFATAALAIIAMVAGVLAPSGTNGTDDVGVVQPMSNMVEMLDDDDAATPMSLDALRQDVFRGWHGLEAGTGVDVALIDTGVAPVDGLDGANVLHGPDLSDEGSSPEVAYLDTYGHGTHMAGIIAGNRAGDEGVAPGARIVSLKVAGHDGLTTVPQVVAAIDWVVEHRNSDGLNIRVLNLSLGQAGVTDHQGDLLSAAVERAWDAGIVVVVAAGNRGDSQQHLDSPAIDPYVMAVAAVDAYSDSSRDDRSVPSWSAVGDGARNPDLVAPGRSIASYRVPGSTIDTAAPSARHGDDLFLGSGTSQAAAVMSGFAAAVIAEYPYLTNDQVKDTITHQAMEMEGVSVNRAGDGHLDGPDPFAHGVRTTAGEQGHAPAAGRSNGILAPTGATWTGGQWAGGQWAGATWTGATWTGGQWAGGQWAGATWTGATWTGATWTGEGWK